MLDAIDRVGLRARSGPALMDLGEGVPKRLARSVKENLSALEALEKAYRKHPRVRAVASPRFILSCSERLIREGASLARDRGMLQHTHAAEHADERAAVRKLLGADDIELLARFGVTGPSAVLAHGVQLDDEEAKSLAAAGTRVVHCPSANLKLGSGIARVHDLQRLGVIVGLGADGAPCNNNLDALTELRHAALLAKARTGTETLPARAALRLATIEGARVLGMDDQIGSIEPGKRADLVIVRVDGPHAEPGGDAASRVVYAARTSDIRHVVLDGVVRVRDGCTDLDEEKILASARKNAAAVRRRAFG